MRVLQISSAKNFGGGERHLADLCAGLSLSAENEIFVALRAENTWQKKLSFLPNENVLYAPLKNSFDVLSARKIAAFIKQKNIRIVHAHLARDYPIAALAARFAKVELVLTRHLLFPLGFSHKITLPKNTFFIAVSEGVRRRILKRKIVSPERVRLIYNGVRSAPRLSDSEKIANKKNLLVGLNLRDNSPLVGIAGEITAHKGQTDFVCAAAEILKKFPNAEFLIAGQDASPLKKHERDLRNSIEKLGLQDKIHFLGWLEDVAPFYSALDVFVSASRVEPFGLVIAEAMAASNAIVATETDGAREIIEDGETGKLVSIENPHELAAAVNELLNDEKLRQNLSANARRAAAGKFSIGRMVEETEKLYREILE